MLKHWRIFGMFGLVGYLKLLWFARRAWQFDNNDGIELYRQSNGYATSVLQHDMQFVEAVTSRFHDGRCVVCQREADDPNCDCWEMWQF